MRLFFLLAILLSASMACDTTISQQVPAVMGDGGGLVNVTLDLVPGKGDIFVSVYPRTGISTQNSIELAVEYARFLAKNNDACDAHVSFGDESASFVDGPSAGTALTVMTYAALENKTLRDDTIITGTIDTMGNVGPVGGLYEKAKGAADVGARYFITPMENFYEMLLLKNIESEYGLEIIEARTVQEVIGFMTENESINQTGIGSRKREIPDLQGYDDSDLSAFRNVSRAMIDLEDEAVGSIEDVDNETGDIRGFFENEVKRQEALLGQGYVFSSANEAFLNYIDLMTINAVLEESVDLPRKKGDISICLSRLERPEVTDKNFEWVVGSDLRRQWASDRIRNTDIDSKLLAEEKFVKFNELVYGEAWCHVASGLLGAAPSGGAPLDESLWDPIARKKLAQARDIEVSSDLAPRLAIAENSYAKGLYGASIFDSVFVIEGMRAQNEISAGIDLESESRRLLSQQRTTLWGQVYQSHGAFLFELNETATAYRTLLLAEGLEEAGTEMQDASESADGIEQQTDIVVFAAIVSTFILFVLIIFIVRRVHGNKRSRRSYRAQKKKRHS